MQLFKQMIEKNLLMQEELNFRRMYKWAIPNFYHAYNIAMSILQIDDENKKSKQRAWKRFLLKPMKINSREYQKIQNFMSEDMELINEALAVIEKNKQDRGFDYGYIYQIGTIGVLAFENPD